MSKAAQKLERWLLLARKGLAHRLRGGSGQRFVFVAGAQRSGTNMLMELLERSTMTDVYHERDTRAFQDYVMREPAVIRGLAQRSKAPVFAIKSLCELDRLPMLLGEFQPSQLVWIVRDYRDMINSALVSFPSLPGSVEKIYHDRTAAGWRSQGMSDETFAHIRRLYRPGMDAASAVALFWYLRNVLFFENGFEQDARVALTFYEQLVSEPERELRNVFDFLQLEYSPFVSKHVFASSIRRRAAPALDPAVDALCAGLLERFQAVREGAAPRAEAG